MASLEAILGARNLTGLIQTTASKVKRVLGDEWFKVTRKTHGNTAEFITVPGQRQNARNVGYGAPPKLATLRNIGGVPTVLIHSFEQSNIGATTLINLLKANSEDQGQRDELGKEEVVREVTAFRDKFENLRTSVAQMQLFTNHLFFDKDGVLLSSASGMAFDAGPGIPAANCGHVTAGGNTNGLVGSWDTTSTDIIGQLSKLFNLSVQQKGFPITQAFYGTNIPGYIGANTTAQQFIRYNLPAAKEYWAGGTIPQGFGNIAKWTPTGQAFFATEDSSGTETIYTYMDPDTIVFTPDPDPSWYEVIEGSYPVPQSIDLKATAEMAASDFREEYGKFSFAKVNYAPPQLEMFMGDTFAMQIRNAGVVYIVKVKGTT